MGRDAHGEHELIDLDLIYRQHHDFVWRTLYHFGLRGDAVNDAVQEVFIVVHRRLRDFDGRAGIKSWLYGIARRVASDDRKRTARRGARLHLVENTDVAANAAPPDEHASATQLVNRVLEHLDADKREVFILAELEGMTAPEIAEAISVNVNTIYARLRAARIVLKREVERWQKRDGGKAYGSA